VCAGAGAGDAASQRQCNVSRHRDTVADLSPTATSVHCSDTQCYQQQHAAAAQCSRHNCTPTNTSTSNERKCQMIDDGSCQSNGVAQNNPLAEKCDNCDNCATGGNFTAKFSSIK